MTIRELIEKLTDADLDKKIDVVAWREAKKGNKNFSITEQDFLGGAISELKTSEGYEYIIDNIPIPDAGASIRELFKKLSDKEIDRDIDDTIAKWREKKSYTGIVFFRLFLQKDDGRSYIELAKVEIMDKNNQVDSTSKDNMNNKIETGLYLPTKKILKKHIEIGKTHKQEVPIDEVLDIVEANLTEKGLMLHENWRSITEQNMSQKGIKMEFSLNKKQE